MIRLDSNIPFGQLIYRNPCCFKRSLELVFDYLKFGLIPKKSIILGLFWQITWKNCERS